jgi:uncharacterized protein (TIGR00730 family)
MPRIVAVFGGSAPKPGTPAYEEAQHCGALLARAGWTVATGGYTGVMEAASRGAHEAGGHVIGVTCTLIENWREGFRANTWVKEEIRFGSLRERLYHLVAFCDATLALPGGIGTLSEIALTWSLIQTSEIKAKPLVVVGRLWAETLSTFLRESDGYIRPEHKTLVQAVESVEEAVKVIGQQ